MLKKHLFCWRHPDHLQRVVSPLPQRSLVLRFFFQENVPGWACLVCDSMAVRVFAMWDEQPLYPQGKSSSWEWSGSMGAVLASVAAEAEASLSSSDREVSSELGRGARLVNLEKARA